ncbi:MAG: TetR/AcrR family transcriptional regulator [Solirubrobacterales bacterium]
MSSNSTARPIPGREPLPREFVVRHQRVRIIDGLAQEVASKGYRAVRVADVVRRAGVARNTFYENFGSKEDCFLAAQQHATSAALEAVVEAAGEIDYWPQRVKAGLAAFLRFVAEHPALARTCMVDALAAGPAAVQHHEEAVQSFASLFKLGRNVSPYGRTLPGTLEKALIGGIFWILYQRLLPAEPEQVEDLLPQLVEFALTPYLGAEAAREVAAEGSGMDAGGKAGT